MDDKQPTFETMSIAESIAASSGTPHLPVTFDHCSQVEGPFFHGTGTAFAIGAEISAGFPSNYEAGRNSNNIYFSTLLEPAMYGAELAVALRGGQAEHIYVVEPTGPFEDDPNVTNKKFPGNPTRSYRSRQPLRVVSEVLNWSRHPDSVLQAMLDNIARLRAEGKAVIED